MDIITHGFALEKFKNQNYTNMKSYRGIKTLATCLISCLVFTTGCFYDKVLPEQPEGEISYSQDMQPFFDASCLDCHKSGAVPPNLEASVSYGELIFGDYIDTTDPEKSLLYTKIDIGGTMEQYATDLERAMTLKWIEQGAKNN